MSAPKSQKSEQSPESKSPPDPKKEKRREREEKERERKRAIRVILESPKTIIQYFRKNGVRKGVFLACPGDGEYFHLGFTLCHGATYKMEEYRNWNDELKYCQSLDDKGEPIIIAPPDKFDRERGREDALIRALRWERFDLSLQSLYKICTHTEHCVIIPESILTDLTEFAKKTARIFKKQSPLWIRQFTGLVDLEVKKFLPPPKHIADMTEGVNHHLVESE